MRTSGLVAAITFLALVAGALILAPAAHASVATEEDAAGLDALNAGDYDQAVAHLSRAIDSHALSDGDQQQAYAARGRALLRKGDVWGAIPDLDRARQLRPDDTETQTELLIALERALPPASIPGAPKPRASLAGLNRQLLMNVGANLSQGGASDEGLIGGP